jgi:hypothetical protein
MIRKINIADPIPNRNEMKSRIAMKYIKEMP